MTKKQRDHMDRIRAARGLPPQTRDNLMERAEAARCFVDRAVYSPRDQRRLELSAFMSIFHPEYSDDRVRNMMRQLESAA